MDWFLYIAIAAAVLVDFLMGPKARLMIRNKVGYWWLALDEIRLDELYHHVTRRTLLLLDFVFGARIFCGKFFFRSFVMIAVVTIIVIVVISALGVSSGEYFYLTIPSPYEIRKTGAIVSSVNIPMDLVGFARLEFFESVKYLSVSFLIPNIAVGIMSLIVTKKIFSLMLSSALYKVMLLTLMNIIFSITIVILPYFFGYLAYRDQFFHAVADGTKYKVPEMNEIWVSMPNSFDKYFDPNFLLYDVRNNLLRLWYGEPLVREQTMLVVENDDGTFSLVVVMEPENQYRPINLVNVKAVKGGFTQVFQFRYMAYCLLWLIVGVSVLAVAANVIFTLTLVFLKATEAFIRPVSSFVLKRLYEDGRPILAILAVLTGAIIKLVEELEK